MSAWTHAYCGRCWDEQRPQYPSPRLGTGRPTTCCFCGAPTSSGIYTREDPELTACRGRGPEHADEGRDAGRESEAQVQASALPPRVWKTGDPVRITYEGRTVDGVVRLASPNGVSLILEFEAILGGIAGPGYVGGMPVYFEDGEFQDLATHRPVTIAERARPEKPS